MGIDTAIRRFFERACPGAFPKSHAASLQQQTDTPTARHTKVLVRDLLTRARRFRGRSGFEKTGPGRLQYQFTAKEFCDEFMADIANMVKAGTYHAIVLCIDVPENMNPDKHNEQKKRDDSNGSGSYPLSFELSMSSNERFDIERLLSTRPLRIKLWNLLLEYTIARHDLFAYQRIIFDFTTGPPTLVYSERVIAMDQCAHDFGEADIMCAFWASRFPHCAVVVESTDSDFIPILIAYVSHCRRTAPLLLSYDRTNTGKSADKRIIVSVDALGRYLSDIGYHPAPFVLACILCGTDFVSKSSVTFFVPVHVVLSAMRTVTADNVTDALRSVEGFRYVLERVFTAYVTDESVSHCAQAEILKRMTRTKGKSRAKFPSQETLEGAFGRVVRNFFYWYRDWASLRISMPPCMRV